MKRQIKYLTVLLLAMAALFAVSFMRENAMIVRIEKGFDAKTINVQLANLQNRYTQLAIQDMDGKVWFSEYVWRADGYAKKFNLREVPEGDYMCFVRNTEGVFMKTFRVEPEDLTLFRQVDQGQTSASRLIYTGQKKPCIARIAAEDETSIGIQLANLQGEDVCLQLNVLGESVAFKQTVSGNLAFAEKLNMDGLVAGDYFLYLKMGEASLVQLIDFSGKGLMMKEQTYFDFAPQTKPGVAAVEF